MQQSPSILSYSLALERDNYLLSGCVLLLKVKTDLNVLKTLSDDVRIWSSDIFTFCESLWQEIHVNDLADFVIFEVASKDELGANTARQLIRHGRGHGDEFSTIGLVDDFHAGLTRSSSDSKSACNCLFLKSLNQFLDDGLAVVIKDLASTEFLNLVEILWRGCGNDFVASSDGKLNSITANA